MGHSGWVGHSGSALAAIWSAGAAGPVGSDAPGGGGAVGVLSGAIVCHVGCATTSRAAAASGLCGGCGLGGDAGRFGLGGDSGCLGGCGLGGDAGCFGLRRDAGCLGCGGLGGDAGCFRGRNGRCRDPDPLGLGFGLFLSSGCLRGGSALLLRAGLPLPLRPVGPLPPRLPP